MGMINETIVAPSTIIATQAIAVIRISGDNAFEIINKSLKQPISKAKDVTFKKLFDNNSLVDEIVINSFVSPNSFTGEDTIELMIHGGIINTKRILDLMIKNGARMATPGEFSQRAFLNGKIDLIQAEGINDLIHAKNNLVLEIGISNMSGANNDAIIQLRRDLMDVISRIQVSIDYPDYDDIEGSSANDLINSLEKIEIKIFDLIVRSKLANKASTGVATAIIGKTNVGKSSLLNALLNEDKAIVTDVHGTTRDIVEGEISFNNVTLNLIDTAGIRMTQDFVENIGIKKSKEYINKADLILFVINYEQINDQDNEEIYSLIKNKQFITIVNKSKGLNQNQKNIIENKFDNVVYTNAIDANIKDLLERIESDYHREKIIKNNDLVLININQINMISQAHTKIKEAITNLKQEFPIDIINVDLYAAWEILKELIGEQYDEEIIDNIFKKYCLGK